VWTLTKLGWWLLHLIEPHSKRTFPASNYLLPKPQAPATVVSPTGEQIPNPKLDPRNLPPAVVNLGWELNQPLDFYVYLSSNREGDVFTQPEDLPKLMWGNLTFGDYEESRSFESEITFPKVRNKCYFRPIRFTRV